MKRVCFKGLVVSLLGVSSVSLVACGDAGDIASLDGESVGEVESALAFGQDIESTAFTSEEDGDGVACPNGYAMTGAECSGSYCDNYRLICKSLGKNSSGGTWSPWFEADGKTSHTCAADQWITGVKCRGDYCDDISVRCTDINATIAKDSAGKNRCVWSNNHSEEDRSSFYEPNPVVFDSLPYSYGPDALVKGISCSGAHCDNKRYYVCIPSGL